MRYWSLIRMLCCPLRSPESASRRFPGGTRRSVKRAAAWIISSFRSDTAILSRCEDRIRDRLIPADFMRQTGLIGTTCIWAGAAMLLATGIATLRAQGPENARTEQARFNALDSDQA